MNQPEDRKSELDERKFEEDLTRMLRRVDAPYGFAERVMTRVSIPDRKPATSDRKPATVMVMRARPRAWFGGTIAAAFVVGIFFTGQIHLRHEREQVARAQSQFEAGMQITDRALEHTRQQLQRAGVVVGD